MDRKEIDARMKLIALAIGAPEGNAENIVNGIDAGLELLTDALHNLGRIADAQERLAKGEPRVGDADAGNG